MNEVKQRLYDMLLAEFKRKPCFTLARTLFLFCHDNEEFFLPVNVQRKFVEGLREQECRAFGMTSLHVSGPQATEGVKQEIIRKIARRPVQPAGREYREEIVRKLSEGTGKIYTAKMIEKINTRYKSILSYHDILEMFILADGPAVKHQEPAGVKKDGG